MKHQNWFRSDLVFSLIAIEAIFIAIATIFFCPWWVPMLFGIAAAFCIVEMIQSIIRLRNDSYDDSTDEYGYTYPLVELLVGTAILAAITAAIFLTIKGLSAWWIAAVGVVAIALLVYACIEEIDVLRIISVILVVLIALFMAIYFIAIGVHNGLRLPFFKQNEVVCEHTYGEDGICVNCGVVCEHNYGEDGKCVNCGVVNTGDKPVGDDNTDGDKPADGDNNTNVDKPADGDNNTNVDKPADGDNNTNVDKPADDDNNTNVDKPADGDNTTQPPAGDDNTDDKPAGGDDEQTPVITPKINAPATIKYAEQIVVTLEGIKADDLIYGGKDFIAVRKLSETEVLITLVGIVNGNDIDFIPEGGYITISDKVSGTNVSIEVVAE